MVSDVKELSGSASADVAATSEECIALLADVERYPEWYPEVVQRVDVVERDATGHASRASTKLHVSAGPLTRDFELLLNVQVQKPDVVRLVRIPHEPDDEERFEVTWRVRDGERRRLDLALTAALPVPRFLPVGGIGDSLAQGFVAAAARELDR
jgi:ribosome-associated toxin RatA of RatAB toxin-antitoxin module